MMEVQKNLNLLTVHQVIKEKKKKMLKKRKIIKKKFNSKKILLMNQTHSNKIFLS